MVLSSTLSLHWHPSSSPQTIMMREVFNQDHGSPISLRYSRYAGEGTAPSLALNIEIKGEESNAEEMLKARFLPLPGAGALLPTEESFQGAAPPRWELSHTGCLSPPEREEPSRKAPQKLLAHPSTGSAAGHLPRDKPPP